MTAIVSQQTVQRWLWMKERGLVTVRCFFSRGFPNYSTVKQCLILNFSSHFIFVFILLHFNFDQKYGKNRIAVIGNHIRASHFAE